MSNTNTKIWLLLVATVTLLCAGCATETAEQRDKRINATVALFCDTARRDVERSSGKAQKDWGPSETATYNSLVLGAIQEWAQAEHRMEPTARRHQRTSEVRVITRRFRSHR